MSRGKAALAESSSAGVCSVPHRLHDALRVLFEGYFYSRDVEREIWDFAVEFRELSLRKNDWRWLVCKGIVQHRPEPGCDHVADEANTSLGKKSAFVLTEYGAQVAAQIFGDDVLGNSCLPASTPRDATPLNDHDVPTFLMDLRELRFRNQLVKRFKLPSPNQERILLAFEEQRWGSHIDDPLPPAAELCPKRRLLDTIKSLNRHQVNQLLLFRGDGTGEGVCWSPRGD